MQPERVTPAQAAKELCMAVDTLRYTMIHNPDRLPIGYVFGRDKCKRHTFIIYRGLLDEYKQKIIGKES